MLASGIGATLVVCSAITLSLSGLLSVSFSMFWVNSSDLNFVCNGDEVPEFWTFASLSGDSNSGHALAEEVLWRCLLYFTVSFDSFFLCSLLFLFTPPFLNEEDDEIEDFNSLLLKPMVLVSNRLLLGEDYTMGVIPRDSIKRSTYLFLRARVVL